MWRSETRGDRSWMEHLARDIVEFGRSGRRYTRAEILAVEVGEIHATLPLRDLRIRRLGGGVVLVTYQSEVDGLLANRSSISRLTDAGVADGVPPGHTDIQRPTDTAAHPWATEGCPRSRLRVADFDHAWRIGIPRTC